MKTCILGAVLVLAAAASASAEAQIFGATLPQARATTPGVATTAFASISNTGGVAATNCHPALAPNNQAPVTFSYQTTNSSNVPVGSPNTPVGIAAGATQGFVFAVTPSLTYTGQVLIRFQCDGLLAPLYQDVNDFNLVSETVAGADIIPVAVTPTSDGVIRIAANDGIEIMAGAAVNIGPTATLTVAPQFTVGTTPAVLTVVETDSGGVPIGSPAATKSVEFVTGVPRYFTVFADARPFAGIPFQPNDLRVALRFRDGGSVLRGQTSAALTAPAPASPPELPLGIWSLTPRSGVDPEEGSARGSLLIGSAGFGLFTQTGADDNGTPGEVAIEQLMIPLSLNIAGGPNGTISGSGPILFYESESDEGGSDGAVAISGAFSSTLSFNTAYATSGSEEGDDTGTLSGFYSVFNGLTATLADMAGTYTLREMAATTAGDVNIGTLTVALNGSVTGSADGGACTIGGQVVDDIPTSNLMNMTLTITGSGCPANLTGYTLKMGTVQPFHPNLGVAPADYYAFVGVSAGNGFASVMLARQ